MNTVATDGTDPYLMWAQARGFRGYAADEPPPGTRARSHTLFCLLELDVQALLGTLDETRWARVLWDRHRVWTTKAFLRIRHAADGRLPAVACVTALVPSANVGALQAEPWVRRVVLSLPQSALPERFDGRAGRGRVGALAGGPGQPVVAVIDDLCPLLHPQFLDADGHTRWRYVWDQDVGVHDERAPSGRRLRSSEQTWRLPAGFAYGREITGARIDAVLARHRRGRGFDEAAAYRELRQPPRQAADRASRIDPPTGAWPLPRSSHGALCASLAAGRGSQPGRGATAGTGTGFDTHTDPASRADLIFVQLPSETVADTSGRGLAANVLDALRYVLDRTHPQAPLVVNLSYGASAGPHDGSSALELAVEQLHAERGDFAVVVPAGNLFPDGAGGAFGSGIREDTRLHAELTVPARGKATLKWLLPPDARADQFMELWAQAGRGSELRAELLAPRAQATRSTVPGSAVIGSAASPLGLQASDAAPRARANASAAADEDGGSDASGPVPGLRAMTLLAVAPTAAPRAGIGAAEPASPAGLWQVRLYNSGKRPVSVQAWIERSDATFGGSGRQSFFPQGDPAVTGRHTLASISHGPSTVVVGGLCAEAVAPYSSAGPSLGGGACSGPDFSACCEASPALPSITVPGFTSGSWVQGNGTSLAAPWVARQLINAMVANPLPPGGQQRSPDALKALLHAAARPLPQGADKQRRGPELA